MEGKVTITKMILNTVNKLAKDRGMDASEIKFSCSDLYEGNPDVAKESMRARLYENLGVLFERIGRNVYMLIGGNTDCILVEGDGREIDFIPDNFINLILTDHPWLDKKANRGGNRNFAPYECIEYTLRDFKEKFRVLKEGGFLIEVIPAELHTNFEYLYRIKKMALEVGFRYYAKITWRKKGSVKNTGRKAKNSEEIIIFSKGEPRSLREDGSNVKLPALYNVSPVKAKDIICPTEKPVELLRRIISTFTKAGEWVLDQFAGSGSTGEACITLSEPRKCILIEKARKYVDAIKDRLNCIKVTSELDFVY